MKRDKISVDRRENFLSGFPEMLGYLVRHLTKYNQFQDAKGIVIRNNLTITQVGPGIWDTMQLVQYQEELDLALRDTDYFGPLTNAYK